MPTTEKQVRVFISSTFRDMHTERDHLVTVVFPELRERVEQLGLEFFDVDLRCGVPAKDLNGETANSWEYCRQWIDRVEPFFVCILGQRYGWVPESRHFRDAADRQRQQREPRSITDIEVRHAVLDTRRKRRSYPPRPMGSRIRTLGVRTLLKRLAPRAAILDSQASTGFSFVI